MMITFTIAFVAVLFLKVKGSGLRLPRENSALIPSQIRLVGLSLGTVGVVPLWGLSKSLPLLFCGSYTAKSLFCPQIITARSSLEGEKGREQAQQSPLL